MTLEWNRDSFHSYSGLSKTKENNNNKIVFPVYMLSHAEQVCGFKCYAYCDPLGHGDLHPLLLIVFFIARMNIQIHAKANETVKYVNGCHVRSYIPKSD